MPVSKGEKKSALTIAVEHGYKDLAELLINCGGNVQVIDRQGYTLLHVASMKGQKDIAELLISKGAEIDVRAEDGCTPLYLAAWARHGKETAQLLLNRGATMEPDIAVMLGDTTLVKQYLDQGVDANSKLTKGSIKGESFLMMSIHQRKLSNASLIRLLLNYGARVNDKTGTFKFSPLYKAASAGARDICELLIAHGADVNAKTGSGESPLHIAARLGHEDVVQLLLDCGADVNALNQAGSSALFDAAWAHSRQIVEKLLSCGAEVNLTDELGFTPLLRAFQTNDDSEETIKVLVIYGADVNAQSAQGYSPLTIAIAQKNKNIVELLLAHGAEESLDRKDSALVWAARSGCKDIVELLIARGANIHQVNSHGQTPLYMAVRNKHRDITQLLLECGANIEPEIAVMLGDIELVKSYLEQGLDVNSELTEGYTFLGRAIQHRHKNLVELLLNYGARINDRVGEFKFSYLYEAAFTGDRDICQLLVNRGAEVNHSNSFSSTPLYRATQGGHYDAVAFLLDCGSDVNANRSIALSVAARSHHQQIVECLLAHGAAVNLRDKSGATPLSQALANPGGDSVVRILLAYGADVNIPDFPGTDPDYFQQRSPLCLAVAQGSKSLVELLLAHGATEGL